jgi:cytochrome P450
MSTLTADVLFAPESRTDPYPLYAELRQINDGVHYIEALDFWVLLRYVDGQRLSRERLRWSSDVFVGDMGFGMFDADDPVHQRYAQVASRNLMIRDAPDHTRLRALLSHAFTGRAARAWAPAIEAVAEEMLAAIPSGETVDVVSDLAEVMPVFIISKLLGVPIADRERFRRLSVAFTETFDPTIEGARRDQAIRDSVELFDYVQQLAEDRQRTVGDDLLTTLIHAEEDGSKLTMDELVASTCMLLVAGNETTADLMATGLAMLLEHSSGMQAVREDPTLIDPAMHEVLRYQSPLQFSPRIATEDVPFGDLVIPKGAKVFFGHGSANRDPLQYSNPDTFDVRRGDKRHLAFAAGPHFCIGNTLALTEGRVFFDKLLQRFSRIDAAGDWEWRTDRFFQRGLRTLPVTFDI